MSVDQMLWHMNAALEVALGKVGARRYAAPLPRPVLKFIAINLPWPKDAPTVPIFVARGSYDFEQERRRCLSLIDEFARKNLDDAWADSPLLGMFSGREWSRLQAKHLNHHLTQFGV
jgi:hypothetical protein